MKRFVIFAGVAAVSLSSPTFAHHVEHLDIPFASRGACESFTAHLSAGDRDYLQAVFPDVFGTAGDVESFLARAFTCEREEDGQWYITDYRVETLESDWFIRKQSH